MVTSDDEVRRTEVLTDDGVPDGLAGTSHTHCEREQGQVTHAVGVLGHDGLVHTDAGVVINVAGFGETHDRVNEDVCLPLTGGADGEFSVSAVHGVAGLECDDLAPGDLLEVCAKLGGGV